MCTILNMNMWHIAQLWSDHLKQWQVQCLVPRGDGWSCQPCDQRITSSDSGATANSEYSIRPQESPGTPTVIRLIRLHLRGFCVTRGHYQTPETQLKLLYQGYITSSELTPHTAPKQKRTHTVCMSNMWVQLRSSTGHVVKISHNAC